jgi:hypothetical protein
MRDEAAAALFKVREWQAVGFFFKGTEAEACGAGLRDDEAAVFEQEFASLDTCVVWSRRREFFQVK